MNAPKELSHYSYAFIKDSAVTLLGIVMLSLISWAAIVRDSDFPSKRPVWFASETLAVSLACTVPVILVGASRGETPFKTVPEFLMFIAKAATVHLMMQYSGVYKHVFDRSY